MQVKVPSGILAVTPLRLLARAFLTTILCPLPLRRLAGTSILRLPVKVTLRGRSHDTAVMALRGNAKLMRLVDEDRGALALPAHGVVLSGLLARELGAQVGDRITLQFRLWSRRSVEVEAAQRGRTQSTWILTGAQDWARLILREEGSGTRALMQRFLETLGEPKPARVIEMDSNETIKQAVIAGLGVAMLSLHTCFEELRQGRLVLLAGRGLPVMRHWYLVTRSAPALDPAATRLADQILNLNGQFFPKIPQD